MDPTTYESFKTPQRQILQGALTLPHPISGLERMVRTWANHKFNYGSGSSFRFFMEPGLNLNPRIHFCLNLLSKNLEIHTGHPKYNSENSLLALQCHMRWYSSIHPAIIFHEETRTQRVVSCWRSHMDRSGEPDLISLDSWSTMYVNVDFTLPSLSP